MRKAVINKQGEVENVILADDDFTIPGKTLVGAEGAGIGWLYQSGKFTPPPVPDVVPQEFEPSDLQVRLAALEEKAGITQADKDAARTALKSST